jgi:hypothetical protein
MKQNVLKEEVDQILSQAFWQKGGIRITENTEVQQQDVAQEEQPVEADDQVIEEQTHVCPLCESTLQEAITDEQLSEHVDFMVGIINEMEDITDDDLTELAEELVSEDSEDDEQLEEAKGKAKKMPAFLAKMNNKG